MKERYIQILGIGIAVVGLVFIAFLYWTEPRSLAEVATKARSRSVRMKSTKRSCTRARSFRKKILRRAGLLSDRADPENATPTHCYKAYSYYRQELRGRLSNDDALFTPGLEAANQAIALTDRVPGPPTRALAMKTATELKT